MDDKDFMRDFINSIRLNLQSFAEDMRPSTPKWCGVFAGNFRHVLTRQERILMYRLIMGNQRINSTNDMTYHVLEELTKTFYNTEEKKWRLRDEAIKFISLAKKFFEDEPHAETWDEVLGLRKIVGNSRPPRDFDNQEGGTGK